MPTTVIPGQSAPASLAKVPRGPGTERCSAVILWDVAGREFRGVTLGWCGAMRWPSGGSNLEKSGVSNL